MQPDKACQGAQEGEIHKGDVLTQYVKGLEPSRDPADPDSHLEVSTALPTLLAWEF